MTVLDLQCLRAGSSNHTAGPETRKLLQWPEATCPGSRCGEVSPCRRTKVGSRPDFRNGDARSTEICRATSPRPWSEFRTKVAILKMVRWRMGSQ